MQPDHRHAAAAPVRRLALAVQASDAELSTQRRLDGRQADDLFLFLERLDRHVFLDAVNHLLDVSGNRTLLDKDHCHAATDVAASRTTHQLATVAIQTDVHFWRAVLAEASLGVRHLVASDDQATLDLCWRTIAFTELEGFGSGFRSTWLSGQTELKVGRLAEDTLGFGSVLHARQLNHDAVGALTLNDWLGNTQLVDAVTYRGQVLLDGVFTDFRQLGRGHRQTQYRLAIEVGRNNVEIVEALADQRTGLFAGCFISEAQLNGTVELRQAAIAQFLYATGS